MDPRFWFLQMHAMCHPLWPLQYLEPPALSPWLWPWEHQVFVARHGLKHAAQLSSCQQPNCRHPTDDEKHANPPQVLVFFFVDFFGGYAQKKQMIGVVLVKLRYSNTICLLSTMGFIIIKAPFGEYFVFFKQIWDTASTLSKSSLNSKSFGWPTGGNRSLFYLPKMRCATHGRI